MHACMHAFFAPFTLQNWKEMTHDWMTGPCKFLMSAPVRLVFWTLFGTYSVRGGRGKGNGCEGGVGVYERDVCESRRGVWVKG